MFERILRPLVLSCLIAILVSGSTINPDDRQIRSRRHASCPSCLRERPDALVSWYSEPVRRDYRGLQPEVDQWPRERQYQPDPPFYSLQDRAAGSRGAPSFGNFGDARKRENPFSIQRDVDFDLAPAPAPPLRSLEPSSPAYQLRYQVPRSMAGPSYTKPNFYDAINRRSNPMPSNRYSHYGSSPEEPSFEGFRPSSTFEERNSKPYQDYRLANYPDHSFNVERPVARPRQYPGRPISTSRLPVTPRAPELERFFPSRREPPRNSPAMYSPQVEHDPYNPSPDPTVYKMAANTGRVEEVTDGSNWREQRRQEAEHSWRDHERLSRIEEYEEQRAKMADEMNQGNGGRQADARFEPEEQEELKGKRGTVGENTGVEVLGKSKVSWSKLTKSSTDVSPPEVVDRVTKPASTEVTTKAVIAA